MCGYNEGCQHVAAMTHDFLTTHAHDVNYTAEFQKVPLLHMASWPIRMRSSFLSNKCKSVVED